VSACKLGFFTSTMVPEGGVPVGETPDPTKAGTIDSEPGSFEGLPWGIDFKDWNPTHPNGNFDLFRKGMLRAWCAGMPGANYNIIANDSRG
jgi:capsid protein